MGTQNYPQLYRSSVAHIGKSGAVCMRRLRDSKNQSCLVVFIDGGWAGPDILGSAFLKNVFTMLDVENRLVECVFHDFY